MKKTFKHTKLHPEDVTVTLQHKAGNFHRFRIVTRCDVAYLHLFSAQDEHLHLSFHGAHGTWGYEWFHTGHKNDIHGAFKFFLQVNPDYVASKFHQGHKKVYLGPETEQNVKDEILRLRKDGDITRKTARYLWDDIHDIYCLQSEEEFHEYMDTHSNYFEVPGELMQFGRENDCDYVCYSLLPVVQDFIRENRIVLI